MSTDVERQLPRRGQLLTSEDVAHVLRIPVESVRALLRDQQLKGRKIGPH